MRARSLLVVMCLAGLSLGLNSPNAGATFHLMKIREVYAGSTTNTGSQFIELQMFQSGQNLVNGRSVFVYSSSNALLATFTFTGGVPNGGNQASILLATAAAQTQFGVTADLVMSSAPISAGGGKVCFEPNNIDCVAWGNYSGPSDGVGSPAPTIPSGQSLDRKITPGCATLLENGDDTNNSAADFQTATPTPRPNSVTPTETACGGGGGGADTDEPSSKITAPKHRSAITVRQARNFQGTAKDQNGTVTKVEIALRQKRKGGCKWWNGSSFVAGSCSTRLFVMANGDKNWSYTLSRKLKPSNRRIRNYTLFSRATDAPGNVESEFVPKANLVRFEVFKPPITCAPGC